MRILQILIGTSELRDSPIGMALGRFEFGVLSLGG